jgi:hypothetical protein
MHDLLSWLLRKERVKACTCTLQVSVVAEQLSCRSGQGGCTGNALSVMSAACTEPYLSKRRNSTAARYNRSALRASDGLDLQFAAMPQPNQDVRSTQTEKHSSVQIPISDLQASGIPARPRAPAALLGEPEDPAAAMAGGVSITVGGYSLGDLRGLAAAAAAVTLALGVDSADAGTAPAAAKGLDIGLLLLLPLPRAAAYQRAAADPCSPAAAATGTGTAAAGGARGELRGPWWCICCSALCRSTDAFRSNSALYFLTAEPPDPAASNSAAADSRGLMTAAALSVCAAGGWAAANADAY